MGTVEILVYFNPSVPERSLVAALVTQESSLKESFRDPPVNEKTLRKGGF